MDTIGAPHSSTARKHSCAEALPEHVFGILDFAAAGASKVAAKERLQHKHQRVVLAALDLLPEDVGGDRPHLGNWNCHNFVPRGTRT